MNIDRSTLTALAARVRRAKGPEDFSAADADAYATAAGVPLSDWHTAHRALKDGSLDAAFALVPRLLPASDITLSLRRQQSGWCCVVDDGREKGSSTVHATSALSVLDALSTFLLSRSASAPSEPAAAECTQEPPPAPDGLESQVRAIAERLGLTRWLDTYETLRADLKQRWDAGQQALLPKVSRALYRAADRLEQRTLQSSPPGDGLPSAQGVAS